MQAKRILLYRLIGPRWVQIDLDAVMHNVSKIRLLKPEPASWRLLKPMPGCGAVEVSRARLLPGLTCWALQLLMKVWSFAVKALKLLFLFCSSFLKAAAAQQNPTVTLNDPGELDSVFSNLGRR